MQELASLREQLLAAESASAGAVKESTHLRQQLRSLQSRSASHATSPEQAELTRQVTPVIDQLLRETYTALRDEFQSDVMYKVRHWNYDFCLRPNGAPCFVAAWSLQAMLAPSYAVLVPDTNTITQTLYFVCACHTFLSLLADRQNATVNIGSACRGQRLSMCSSQ